MKYTLQDGVDICKELEPVFAEHGYHLALCGSLLYRGESDKDIDIIIYNHNNPEKNIAELPLEKSMQGIDFALILNDLGYRIDEMGPGGTMVDEKILKAVSPKGHNIDFFRHVRTSF